METKPCSKGILVLVRNLGVARASRALVRNLDFLGKTLVPNICWPLAQHRSKALLLAITTLAMSNPVYLNPAGIVSACKSNERLQ
jgi:hypothetical protein